MEIASPGFGGTVKDPFSNLYSLVTNTSQVDRSLSAMGTAFMAFDS
jgi:hypothetical protein